MGLSKSGSQGRFTLATASIWGMSDDWVASQSSEHGAWPDGLGLNSAILAVAVPGPVPGAGVLGLAGLLLAGFYARAVRG